MSKRFLSQIQSTVANGTAPLIVASTTAVTNLNADLLDGQHGSYFAPIASPTFTGTVNLPTVSISGITTTSDYINRITVNGNSSWLQQDGTGRVHWYWNTLGGTSPTFTNAVEDASALTLHVNNNGNGGTFFHRSANGASASAGGPITWTTTLYVDLATITYKGNRIPTVTDKLNAFAATTSAELAGVISDETGSGSLVFATSPTFTGTVTVPTPVNSTDAATKGYVDSVIINTQISSYILALADAGEVVEMNVATANNLTIPASGTVNFPIGTSVDIIQYGAGQTTIVAAGGVTLRSSGSKLKLSGQYSGATLYKRGTDEWIVIGDLSA